MPRLDGFSGSDAEYIIYLETHVSQLRGIVSQQQHPQVNSPAPQPLPQQQDSQVSSPAPRPLPLNRVESIGSTSGTIFHTWRPPEQLKQAKPRQPTSRTAILSNKKAKNILDDTPAADCWSAQLGRYGIPQGKVTAALLFQDKPRDVPNMGTPASLIDRLKASASFAVQEEKSACRILRQSRCQQFVLLCCCAVLHRLGLHGALDIAKICLDTDNEMYCVQSLRSIRHIHALIAQLAQTQGWGARASHLLLLWNKKPTWYQRLTGNTKSLEYLKSQLTQKSFLDDASGPAQDDVTEWVYELLEESFSREDIYKALLPDQNACIEALAVQDGTPSPAPAPSLNVTLSLSSPGAYAQQTPGLLIQQPMDWQHGSYSDFSMQDRLDLDPSIIAQLIDTYPHETSLNPFNWLDSDIQPYQ